MGFLAGPITFECYRILDPKIRQFGPEQIALLKRFGIGERESTSLEEADVGFLAGEHLFDRDFDLEKNVIGESLHCGVRIDTNQIPSAVRKAWLQMELAVATAEAPSGRPTKAQRQEAREAVEARCEDEAKSGRFRRMQQFPVLWDAKEHILYFGTSSAAACDHACDLFVRAFDLELERLTASRRAQAWAAESRHKKALEETVPASFFADAATAEVTWWNNESGNCDFLGNEFLLWLWWRWETQSDTLTLPDDSEVTGMLAKTLRLECPRGESGKETITAESPVRLPEALQAIRSGKLPRKVGLNMVRHGQQFELTLQAETFSVSGAKIHSDANSEGRALLEERIESLRGLQETLDLLFRAFCQQRIGKPWPAELEQMQHWLKSDAGTRKKK